MSNRLKRGLIAGSILLVVGMLVLFFLFRSHTNDAHLKVIPKNAAAVLKINISELASKADLLNLLQEPAFKSKSASGKNSLNQLLSNPFAAGIDPLENVYGFLSKEDECTIAAIVFKVRDKNDLSSFVSELGFSQTPEEESGIYYSEIDQHRGIAWNEESGIMLSVSDGDKRIFAAKFLNQKTEESILSNNSYKLFSEKVFDIGLYLDNKRLSQMSGAGNSLSSFGFTDGHGELAINFEKDKISTRYTNFPETKQANDILKKNGFAAKHFEALAPQSPLVCFGISTDINSLFSSIEKDALLKNNLADLESNIELPEAELKELFNGDLSIAFTDFKDISTYDPRIKAQVVDMVKQYGSSVREELALAVPMAYVSIGVTDVEKTNLLLQNSGMQKMGEFYAVPGLNFITYAVAKNEKLFITNDYYAAEAFSKNGNFPTQLPESISTTNPLLCWADLDQKHFPVALTQAMKENYNTQTLEFFLTALKPFKSLKMESSENGSQLDIFLTSGNGNSLYRLLSYFGTLSN